MITDCHNKHKVTTIRTPSERSFTTVISSFYEKKTVVVVAHHLCGQLQNKRRHLPTYFLADRSATNNGGKKNKHTTIHTYMNYTNDSNDHIESIQSFDCCLVPYILTASDRGFFVHKLETMTLNPRTHKIHCCALLLAAVNVVVFDISHISPWLQECVL